MPSKPAPLASGIGRPPKHADRLLSRVVRKNQLDRRTGVSKLLERVADDLATDRGGWANVGAAEEIAIRRAAFLTVLCGSIEAWCLGQADVIVDGELLGPLKKGLATHQANLLRTLAALGFRPERTKTPTLSEYLEARRNGTPSRLLKKSLSTLRQAQGERKNAMKSGRGSAHAELVEAWGGVFQRAASSIEKHDHTEAKTQAPAGGHEAGKASCGGSCGDCHCGEPEAPAGGEDADRIRAERVGH